MRTIRAASLSLRTIATVGLLLAGMHAHAETTSKVNGINITLPTADEFAKATGIKPLDKPLHVKVCIFDPVGNNGPAIQYAKDLVLQARRWNVFLDIRAFTDERVAAEDFKAGQCDAVALSTFRAKQFNKFMGSFDAVGALHDYNQVRTAMNVLYTNPKVAPYMVEGPYQVGGIVPIGAVYVMVNDRSINSIEKAAGKKVAVLDFDKSQAKMVQQLGASPVPSDITNFSGKFNNGQVDIIAAPAVVFRPLELYRGMGDKGGIFRIPLVMMSGSVVFRREKFLKEIPDLDDKIQKIRNFAITYLDQAYTLIDSVEKDIPERYWMDLSAEEKDKYFRMMREARLQLMHDGTYDPRMLGLLKKVRCKHNPASYECALKDE
ncbi:MAG: transporter [Moraxellaceae bacterium]|jgi:TRAP-type C4-dicarboxylate transport system substrate-binding protein|nr:transporter [Moraxellaceae bacterium]